MNNLTIIVLTYDNLSCTKKCIENLYKYTKDFNLVIVDNNSCNDTIIFLQDIEKNDNVIVEYNDENEGIIEGRNQGYSIAKEHYPYAELIMFLDNDQFVGEGWQESHLEWVEKGYDVVGCESWRLRNDFYPEKKITDSKEYFSYVGCGGMIIKKRVIEDIGLFDERFSPAYFEDPDLCWRAYGVGYRIAWNYNHNIEHNPHNLLNEERKKYFRQSWDKFQEKWEGRAVLYFRMEED